jgi:predicted NBD/HSP70 family sugar kinase
MGCASRADLAKAAGISQPTAGKIITHLLEMGVLQLAGPGAAEEKAEAINNRSPRLGRPGQLLRLDAERLRFIAIELGVNDTLVTALPIGAPMRDEWAIRFKTPADPANWLAALRQQAARIHPHDFWGVLMSVPGIVDEERCRVIFSPNLHWLGAVDLTRLVRQAWDLPVLLEQEIRALALGHLAAEPETEDFLLVDFGQGVGGAIVSEGKLQPHPTPLSGELGHTPIAGNSRRCGCGATGCLETLVSERGLLESLAAADGLPTPTWEMLAGRVAGSGVTPWLAETLDATARVVAGALNVLGIHRVVVTGALAQLPGVVLDHFASGVRRGALWARFGEIECKSAPRRRAAGLVAVGIDRLVLPATGSLILPVGKQT